MAMDNNRRTKGWSPHQYFVIYHSGDKILFDILKNRIKYKDCILEMGENKPEMGWM